MFGMIARFFGGGILDNVFGMVGDHFKEKRKLKLMEASLKQTVLLEREKRLTTQANADVNWDMAQVKASETSWKDEFWTVIFGTVFIMHFIPFFKPWVEGGWETLGQMDDFWKMTYACAIAAAFGTKELAKFYSRKKKS